MYFLLPPILCQAVFRFSILRASAGDAMSLPSSRERRTTFSTSSPFDFANTPREI